MKRNFYLAFFLLVSFISKAQVLDSSKIDKIRKNETNKREIYSLNVYNQNIDKSTNQTQKVKNDIQKNLNLLNSKFTVNPYQIPKTITNPNGAATPRQAVISGLLKGIIK